MASTSEQLAQAVSSINALQQTYAQEVGKWQTERTTMAALLANAVAAIPNLKKVIYVDSVNGIDTNEGSLAKPYASLDKALDVASLVFAGNVSILLKPGVYDVAIRREYFNINLYIGGTEQNNVNSVIVNWKSSAHDISNGLFWIRYCTVNRAKVISEGHQPAIIKLINSGAAFGAYVAGGISATNRSFHFISDNCPLVSCERIGGLVSFEYIYAENTSATPTPIAQQRGMTLIYRPVSSIMSNFTTPATEIKHASVSL